ncbi:hypothetical protein Hanom_Chr02g00146991 [Helianthus anomalus]
MKKKIVVDQSACDTVYSFHFELIYIIFRVNYKFCPLRLHQITSAVFLAKSLQAVSLTFQNLAHFVL